MISRRQLLARLAGGTACAGLAACFGPDAWAALADDTKLAQLASRDLKDLQADVHVVSADQGELAKISRDFGMAYRLKNLTMRYKEPNKLRMEGSIGSLIINGAARQFRVPAIKLSKVDDLGESPGKRYTLMDIGILTASALSSVNARYIKDELVGDIAASVFDIAYKGDDSVRYRVWIDAKAHVLVKRSWYDGQNNLKATFIFQEPKQVASDLWVPTRIEIRNAVDAVAAVTAYSDVKVNQGLDDALFQIG
jgi:outer membrane lipoprotein-sorting protein